MKSNYSPSVNIIRDSEKELDYIVTENAEKSAIRILNDFNKGFHSFSIIGSYGTGKSSFLWAFQQTLTNNTKVFNIEAPKSVDKIEVINIVGDYTSIIESFNTEFFVEKDFSSNQKLFDAIFQRYKKIGDNGMLIIQIDEFGKFLEFAANNNPEKEMYFIQQLAEFVNDPLRRILLLTTLHQGLDTYAFKLSDSQKNEWRKVRGRLQEITFNEPVEQLLALASKHFVNSLGETKETEYSKSLIELQEKKKIFSTQGNYFSTLKNTLFPLDIFSAYILTHALQRYGQNERSLFSFLQASDDLGLNDPKRKNNHFSISAVYDYLLNNFYQLLTTRAVSDFSKWSSIRYSIQRAEAIESVNLSIAEDFLKTIGLLGMFSSKGAKIDEEFIVNYLSDSFEVNEIRETIELLEKHKIIKYYRFKFSYELFEGTDLDIEDELAKVENQVPEVVDLVYKLETYFEFPVVTAKANSYKTGTPRLFEYKLSNKPISEVPKGEIDGFINLVFNTKLSVDKIKAQTKGEPNATIYCFFKNTEKISSALFEIEKTNQVLKNIEDDNDKVAIRELHKILRSNQVLLNHYVLDSLYNKKDVEWIYKGEKLNLKNKKDLNKQLSVICEEVYHLTPIIRNELFNKHKPSGAIASARKSYFDALTNNFVKEDLAFDSDKFPPEKTIYHTLLRKNDIHIKTETGFTLTRPNENSDIYKIWEVSEEFLSSAKKEPKKVTDLIDTLTAAPYKLKQGVIDFWIPTFLFLRRGDYALYSEGKFKPYINKQELYLITRTPELYSVKSFELNDLRLSFFNKYRELLSQEDSNKLNLDSFIESIRPILLTFRGLIPYSQKTNRLSKEAIELRKAIEFAQDPEKVFFDEFPQALGFNSSDLLESNQKFDDYIYKFQITLDEIKNSYNELLNRFEKFIITEIIGRKCDFETYKSELSKRFTALKEHQLLNKQKTFIQRVNSPLNDRDSWLASISQALIGKPLTSIEDKDEKTLKDNLKSIITELDNLSVLEKLSFDSEKEEVFKLDFTSKKTGLIPHIVRIPKSKLKKAQNNIDIIDKELGSDKQMRIAILTKLLKQELDNE
ncbi:hypothetical protein [Brumimicrobium oceani]|uniref:ATP-binding protein n=1 Tax=Brumimicrobium oceani TaxID=2100725 RepID=A0A2U2XCC4_9FLAO|nr:hypothetical protein [Brumimicrobium oceani]PWH85413.1 hypothetical protein DIT68_09130 [Brumimicrobium oceani]